MTSVLGVGTATLIADYGLGPTGRTDSPLQLLRRAIEAGVLYIDTAPVYQDAEAVLGDLQPLLRSTQHGTEYQSERSGFTEPASLRQHRYASHSQRHRGSLADCRGH
jgi:hypothetical protein